MRSPSVSRGRSLALVIVSDAAPALKALLKPVNPSDFSRSERCAGIVFLDLPAGVEKAAIRDRYIQQFELDANQN